MITNLFILMGFFASTAEAAPNPKFLVDYTYQCQKTVKDYDSSNFVVDTTTEFQLKVGNKREAIIFGIEVGGPWFSLVETVSGDGMVFGITECRHSNNFIPVDSYCTDKVTYDDEGYGYYWAGTNWKGVTAPKSLPTLFNNNLIFSADLWNGSSQGIFRTVQFSGIDSDHVKEKVTVWNCERSL